MFPVRAALSWVLLCVSCSADLPSTPPIGAGAGGSPWAGVELEPPASPDRAPAVLRLRVTGGADFQPEPTDLQLFEGELSANYLRRVAAGELPAALAERRVPSLSWRELDASSVVVAPSVPLIANQRYSLVSRRLGLLVLLGVAPEVAGMAERRWPPKAAHASAAVSFYCSAAWPRDWTESTASLPPSATEVRLKAGDLAADGASCVRLELAGASAPEAIAAPPLELAGVPLDPAPLVHRPAMPVTPPACAAPRLAFGPGCADVQDDRVIVQNQALRTLWQVRAPRLESAFDVEASAAFALLGLTPESRYSVAIQTLDAAGSEERYDVGFTTSPARPRVVVNEVLADAIGGEPAQEWIELYNDGSQAVDLRDWRLEDAGGGVTLPRFELMPGAYVLLVHESYVEAGTGDVSPAAGTALLRLPALGTSGLSNAGERLLLRAADGSPQSSFPAAPKPRAGSSVARRAPSTLDGDPTGFGLHAPPGASPGGPNQLP